MTEREVELIEGPPGWGEFSPLPGYPCDVGAARASAHEAAFEGWPAALRTAVPVNALVSDAGSAAEAAAQGFTCVKVKVGGAGIGADVDRVAAVRAAIGPAMRLRVDANGAWDLDTAVDALRRLAAFDLELAEQPVASLEDLARLRRRVDVPLAADECVRTIEDARRLASLHAADAVVLKVQPLGGVRAALRLAEAAGVPAVVTSMLETSVGLAAGLALAACLPELHYACGLATATLLAADVVADPLLPEGGMLTLRRPVPDPVLIARYRVAA